MTGTLYLVSTPIGNINDISIRAIDVLNAVDIILTEDTRVTSKLLKHHSVTTKKSLQSFNQINEDKKAPDIISELKEGKDVALVSDAGTPLISDPGYKFIKQSGGEKGAPLGLYSVQPTSSDILQGPKGSVGNVSPSIKDTTNLQSGGNNYVIDKRLPEFKNLQGAVTQTLINHTDTIIHNKNNNDLNIFVRRSFSNHLWLWINDSAKFI